MNGFADRIAAELGQLKQQNLLREPRVVTPLADGRCSVDGRTVVNFAGNDYLGLAHEPAMEPFDTTTPAGATASAAVAGRSKYHDQLEQQLAEFEQTQAALLFPSGFAANFGTLTGLIREHDAVFCERFNHASIVDAARACDGQLFVYRNDRLQQLRTSLQKRRHQFHQVFIVTDGVFSMDGTIAPLGPLTLIAKEFDCVVIVDEAHGTGVLGRHGRGACDHHNVEGEVLIRVGTMSKAMGGLGGFVASTADVVTLLRNTARTQFFSTALPPAVCRHMLQSLKIIREQPERRARLHQSSRHIRELCRSMGVPVMNAEPTPIVPIAVSGESRVLAASARLLEQGYFVPAIRWPTVKQGRERLRLSLAVQHSQATLDDAVHQIAQVLAE